ncbi:MAG: DUF5719 family protein [Lapillicoccus sp.]
MTSAWWGIARAGVVVVAGVGLTYAATELPGTVSLTPAVEKAALQPAALAPVTSNSIGCPGPETEGLQGVPPVAGTTTVYATSPPSEALEGVDVGTSQGSVSLAAVPAGTALGQSDKRGTLVIGTLTGASAGLVTARGPLAPGLAALQTTVSTEGDDRAGVAVPCAAAKADLWLVAGGGGSTRRERVVLTNPGANTVSADVSVRGGAGLLPSTNGRNISVPPRGRASLFVDALVGPENTPVVHVVATGGVLTAVLEDSWIDGATGRGADDASPTAAPANEQVIPAVFLDGPGRLRVAVPGADETVVQARALTENGPVALPGDGVVRVPGGAVRDIDLGSVPKGAYAIQLRADHPVVGGVMVERRPAGAAQSDFGWTTSTDPVAVVAGTPLPAGARATLMLVATGEASSASVHTVAESGAVETKTYSLVADSTTTVDLAGARQVWVHRTAGTLRAGLALDLAPSDPQPLFSLVPLNPAVVTSTQVPVRQVPG